MDQPKLSFPSQKAWEDWLEEHQGETGGIWLKIAKKASGIPTVSYDEAVESALCFGWIDGQKRAFDETHWLQKFTPRRKRSVWSKVNVERVGKLTKAGRMKPAGQAEVAAAKADGRWDAAYHPQSTAEMPDDFQLALDRNPKAKQFFSTLKSSNRYTIYYRIQEARRPETRQARIDKFISNLERGQTDNLFN